MIPLKDDNPTSSRPIVTYFLIGLCVVVFLMQLGSQSYRTLILSYGLIPSVLMGHDQLPMDLYAVPAYMTIFSSMFMHGGWMHLIMNMLFIWVFADNIEDNLGSRNFIIFYILCGIGAAMAHVLMDTHSQIPVIGASGAISGVLGAYIINHPKARILVLIPFFFIIIIKIRALYVLGYWFVLQFINSYTVSSQGGGVAYAAHIGGFVSGMMTTSIAVPGPSLALYAQNNSLRKHETRAMIFIVFMFSYGTAIIIQLFMNGIFDTTLGSLVYVLMPAIIGTFLGNKISGNIPDKMFRKLVSLILILTATYMLLSNMIKLLG